MNSFENLPARRYSSAPATKAGNGESVGCYMKFIVELTRTAPGTVFGRIIDPQEGDDVLYEVTVATMDTKLSQTRVLRDLARHLNWFVDLSEGGTK